MPTCQPCDLGAPDSVFAVEEDAAVTEALREVAPSQPVMASVRPGCEEGPLGSLCIGLSHLHHTPRCLQAAAACKRGPHGMTEAPISGVRHTVTAAAFVVVQRSLYSHSSAFGVRGSAAGAGMPRKGSPVACCPFAFPLLLPEASTPGHPKNQQFGSMFVPGLANKMSTQNP